MPTQSTQSSGELLSTDSGTSCIEFFELGTNSALGRFDRGLRTYIVPLGTCKTGRKSKVKFPGTLSALSGHEGTVNNRELALQPWGFQNDPQGQHDEQAVDLREGCPHAHSKQWAWHPDVVRLLRKPSISNDLRQLLCPQVTGIGRKPAGWNRKDGRRHWGSSTGGLTPRRSPKPLF